MKTLINFTLEYLLDALGNVVLAILAISVYLMGAFGGDRAQTLIDRSASAIGTVIILVLLWTLLGSLTGALVRALKKLKEKMNKNEVQL